MLFNIHCNRFRCLNRRLERKPTAEILAVRAGKIVAQEECEQPTQAKMNEFASRHFPCQVVLGNCQSVSTM